MAQLDRYVDTDVVGGLGDGSSWANAYSSMNTAEAGLQADLVTATNNMVIHFRSSGGTADTTATTFTGWTLSETYNLVLIVDQTDRHAGKWDTSKYRLYVASGSALTISEDYISVKGLQINIHTPTGSSQIIYISGVTAGANKIYVENCILKGGGGTSYTSHGIRCAANTVLYTKNTVAYNCGTGYGFRCDGATHYVYNCTAYGSARGFSDGTAGTLVLKNCLGASNTSDFTVDATSTLNYCSSSDATADDRDGDGTSGNNLTSQTFTFGDAANGDFHLQVTDTGAKDHGTSLASDAVYPFSDDIDGVTRTGTWDIGADEYVSASVASPKGIFSRPILGCLGGMI